MNTQSTWAQTDMTNQAMGSTASGNRVPTSSKTFASWRYLVLVHTCKQLFEFLPNNLFQHIRRCTDKFLRRERCAQTNHICCRRQTFFNLMRNGMNLTSNEIACDSAFGPTFGCERAHHQNTIDKQGRGFFKPRPCGGFDRRLPLVQHKMRRTCHCACRHDGLKF